MLFQPSDSRAQATPQDRLSKDLESLKAGLHVLEKPESGSVKIRSEIPAQILADAQSRARLQERRQLFDIQKVDVAGTIKNSVVELDVQLQVEIDPSDEWVRVPIGFETLHITELSHTTDVEGGQGKFDKEKLPSKSWLLKGSGIHRLNLKLLGAIAENADGQYRFRPAAPRATVSHMVLQIPQKVDAVGIAPPLPHQVRSAEDGSTSQLETWGLEPASQFSWFPRRTTADEDVEIRLPQPATMSLDLASATMKVQQPVAIIGGALTELSVRLPADFVAASIRAEDSTGRNIVEPLSEEENRDVLIQFSSPVIDKVVLQYDLLLKKTEYPQKITVQLPDLQDATNESANVEIFVPNGLEVGVSRPNESNTRQKRVESAGRERTSVVAWQLLSDSAKLELSVSETEAFYSVSPTIMLEANRSTVLLNARFGINTAQGSLTDMRILWPGLVDEGWTILDVTMKRAGSTEDVPVARLTASEIVDVVPISFQSRQSGQFEVEIQAARDLAGLQNGPQIIHLPDIESPTPHTTTVALLESDEYSISVAPPDADPVGQYPALPLSRLPEEMQDREGLASAWLVETVTEGVRLNLAPQQARVRSKLRAELSIANGSIHIREAIDFDVLYLDLDEVVLSTAFEPTVRIEGADQPLEGVRSEPGLMSYALPGKRRGRFRLLVDYYWVPDAATAAKDEKNVSLPLALPGAGIELSEITVVTNRPRAVAPADAQQWQRVYVEEFAAAWRSTTPVDAVDVVMQQALTAVPQIRPKVCILKSVVQANLLRTSMTTVFDDPVTTLLYAVDRRCLIDSIYVDNQEVSFSVVAEDDVRSTIQLNFDAVESIDFERPWTVMIVYRQPLAKRQVMFSHVEALTPSIVGQKGTLNGIWAIEQNPGEVVLSKSNDLEAVRQSDLFSMPSRRSRAVPPRVFALLSSYPPAVRGIVLAQLRDWAEKVDDNVLLSGVIPSGSQELIFLPRRTILLSVAVFGLLTYMLLIRLDGFALSTVLVLVTTGVLSLFAVAPDTSTTLLLKLLPGGAVALVAALLHRVFSHSTVVERVRRDNTDETTIFTFDQLPDTSAVNVNVSESSSTALTP